MTTLSLYLGAALAEIAGCFAFWVWLRLGKSVFWLIPGMLALAMFAYLLTRKVIYLNARLLKSCSPGHLSTPTKPIACVKNE